MTDQADVMQALSRAGKRALYHLVQAAVEGLKAVEAVIEEVGSIGDRPEEETTTARTRIEVE
jgi:hypothetical protein